MSKIYWLHGIYRGSFRRGFGGGERSYYMRKLIQEITGYDVIDVYWYDPNCKDHEYEHCLRISRFGKFIRGLLKILKKITNKMYFDILGFHSDKYSVFNLANNIGDDDLIVIDGMYGLMMFFQIYGSLHSKPKIMYLSHNFEREYYGNTVIRNIVSRNEKKVAMISDIIIAATYRDKLLYNMIYGTQSEKIIVFPNVFPVNFDLQQKEDKLTIAFVEGSVGEIYAHIAKYIADRDLAEKLIYIGKHKPQIENPKIDFEYYKFIDSRRKFLETLSKAHIGINIGLKKGGSNVKKYDYALASLYILSYGSGSRGEFLPGENTFLDIVDLETKIKTIINLETIIMLGEVNRKYVLNLYSNSLKNLKEMINRL